MSVSDVPFYCSRACARAGIYARAIFLKFRLKWRSNVFFVFIVVQCNRNGMFRYVMLSKATWRWSRSRNINRPLRLGLFVAAVWFTGKQHYFQRYSDSLFAMTIAIYFVTIGLNADMHIFAQKSIQLLNKKNIFAKIRVKPWKMLKKQLTCVKSVW